MWITTLASILAGFVLGLAWLIDHGTWWSVPIAIVLGTWIVCLPLVDMP